MSRMLRSGDKMVQGETMVAEALSSNGEGSASLLHWRDFRMLLPGGMPIASHPDNPASSLLLIYPVDLEVGSLADWQAAFSSALILSPAAIPPGGWVHVRTDGKQM